VLALLPGSLSPHLWEGLARVSSRLPFAQAAEELAFFWRVIVSDETARRLTEQAGAAYVAVQTAEQERIGREWPEPPQGPALQQVSVDGALVHTVKGEWVEVKTVAIGTVTTRIDSDGQPAAHTTDLSYFSRVAEASEFRDASSVETLRRGTQTAGVVVSVNDGAVWIQGVVDRYRLDAVRVLDFAHAHPQAGTRYLAKAASAVWGRDTPALHAWMDRQTHALKHDGPTPVLLALHALPVATAPDRTAATKLRDEAEGYFLARLPQLQYPDFLAKGYPIGSGAVESAGKVVVQARLKGSGMRWGRDHLNPMVALRTIVCSGRWAEAWPQITDRLRAQTRQHQHDRWLRRHPPAVPAQAPAPPAPKLVRLSSAAKKMRAHSAQSPRSKDGCPAANHPWRGAICRRTQTT
jgi:hypothetical protein